jgi:hypothetical protein
MPKMHSNLVGFGVAPAEDDFVGHAWILSPQIICRIVVSPSE